jgi:transcriptional regulator with XRE-family HTH domain
MKNRIKDIRKMQNLSQDAFGKRLGITGASVSRLESGDREPSDQTILSICREFSVNEYWLRTGEGDMYKQLDRYQELSSFFGDLMMTEPDVRHRLIGAIMHADLEELRMIERFAWRWVEETKKTDP